LTDEQIAKNINGIFRTFDMILPNAVVENNSAWLEGLSFIGALRDIGRHFSVNKMLTMDSVKNRLVSEQNMSFLEFNYMVLQAFDFVELNKRKQCILQMGGSDQWGNITMGIDLCRRMRNKEVFGLTSSLLSTASGKKMGKTANGAVWLNKSKLSIFDFWQFWRNVDDADVPKFLSMLTKVPMDEVRRLSALKGNEINEAKIILANQVTTIVHGVVPNQSIDEMNTVTIDKVRIDAGISLIDLLVEIKFGTSKSDARRHIQGRGIRLNELVIDDPSFVVTPKNVIDDTVRLSHGKKKSIAIRIV
jgi:tyrosyl-tRNA synthetase